MKERKMKVYVGYKGPYPECQEPEIVFEQEDDAKAWVAEVYYREYKELEVIRFFHVSGRAA